MGKEKNTDYKELTCEEVFDKVGSNFQLGEEIINARVKQYKRKRDMSIICTVLGGIGALYALTCSALTTNTPFQIWSGVAYLASGGSAIDFNQDIKLYNEAIKATNEKREEILARKKYN